MAVQKRKSRPGVLSGIVRATNPVFLVVSIGVPVGVLVSAMNSEYITFLNYAHIMAGALWTGIDLFLGFVLGPVLGRLDPRERVAVFSRLMPKMTFLMPVLAGVTITAGIELTRRLGHPLDSPWVIAAFVVTGILGIQGFGFLLPNEVRIFQQLLSDKPDTDKIARLGMQNARLGGLQGIFQLAVIFIMASIRF
jgi:hypothetical protein